VDRGIALSFLDLGTRRGWVVSTTPRPIYPRERLGTHCTGGWVGPRAGLDVCEKFRPHRDFFLFDRSLWFIILVLDFQLSFVSYCMLWIFQAGKIRRLRSGANPRSWVPEASMQTPRPPKPLFDPRTVQPVANCYTD
jgi:hypothetical protein